MTQTADREINRFALWFGLLGGAVAWAIHLLVIYILGELACTASFPGFELWGVPGASVLLIAASIIIAGVAGKAALTARQNEMQLGGPGPEGEQQEKRADSYMARAGFLLSNLFVIVILVETLPVFFLPPCSL